MSYSGYTNEATYMVDLLVSNEYEVYRRARAVAMEYPPERSGPAIERLVRRALGSRSPYLSHDQVHAWQVDISRAGGLAQVNWQEIAQTQGQERRRGGPLRTASRAARRRGVR